MVNPSDSIVAGRTQPLSSEIVHRSSHRIHLDHAHASVRHMIRIALAERRVAVDGQPLRLSPQFFQLYCFLAYTRVCGKTAYVSARDIHRLSGWHKANLDSVGKAIHRHVAEARRSGLDLIQSPSRAATRFFGLNAAADEISFDAPLADLRLHLGLDLAVSDHSPEAVERALRFSWAVVRARLAIERGNFQDARAALEEAECAPCQSPRNRAELLLLWSSLLEHEGKPKEALTKAEQALRAGVGQALDYLTQARAHIRLGFLGGMLRQPERYPQAKAHYQKAQALLEGSRHFTELSQIATGLGHLARRDGDLESALAYFLAALEYATQEAWGWGIQAGLFNLGLVQAERGDVLNEKSAKRAAYQQAQRWMERAIEFTNSTGIGRYSSEALGVLSYAILRQGKGAAAVRWARAALERAREAGNTKSEAVALEALGAALAAVGMDADAREAMRAAAAAYRRLGFAPDVERVAQTLAEPATPSGPARIPRFESVDRRRTPLGSRGLA
jgi:tetratricopeptide (TPR) repeat protein